MPMVGKKKFPYNEAGMKAADAYAKKSGAPMAKKAVAKKAPAKKAAAKKSMK